MHKLGIALTNKTGNILKWLMLAWMLLIGQQAMAHSVGQVQTTKYFAPETVNMLTARAAAGSAGFQVGDTVTYIIQFTPIANNAIYGANGYVTDYVPSGAEVVQASIVQKDSSGNFYDVSPSLPGAMPRGWGASGNNTYLAPFNTAAYDATGRCSTGAFTNNCSGKLSQLYADTGIFYSTDSRTAQYPSLPTRVSQTNNGYNINPTRAAAQMNPLLGQAKATTHNLWDAAMTNAFGTTAAGVTGLATPNANSVVGALNSSASGSTPYNAGSGVAGPQTGYTLDYSGNTGPWQRIYYPGSRIGDNSSGPATAASLTPAGAAEAAQPFDVYVDGSSTLLGYSLSTSNPLPSGTNAVRWAIGRLVVGQVSFVKITLRITAPLPTAGLINGSEVFGGDASDLTGTGTSGSIDNPWSYHVPSVADNNSNLFVGKTLCVYDATATTCTPASGSYVTGSTTLTYKITYLNSGNADQHNVVLVDTFPCQTAAVTNSVRIGTVTGPLSTVMTGAYSVPVVTATTAGNCATTPQTRQNFTFPTMPTLGPGGGGSLIINVLNNAATVNDDIINTAYIKSNEVNPGVTSNAVAYVSGPTTTILTINKSSPQTTASVGGTVTYTLTISNTGNVTVTNPTVWDFLPSVGGSTVDTTIRFNYLAGSSSITSTGLVSSGLVTTVTTAVASGVSPYSTLAGSTNTVALAWTFGTTSTFAPGANMTITFAATVGNSVAATGTPYYNNALITTTTYNISTGNSAPITIGGNLSVTKSMSCYYTSSVAGALCLSPNAGNTIPDNARVKYDITYRNTGAGTLNNVILTETLPCQINATAGVVTITALVTAPIGNTGSVAIATPTLSTTGTCISTFPVVALPAGTLTVGQSGTVSFEIQLNSTTTGHTYSQVVNSVQIASGTGTVAQAQASSTIQSLAALQMTKSVTPATIMVGQTVTYTLVVSNVGTTAALSITVYDELPSSTSTFGATTGRYNAITSTVVISGLTSVTTTVSGTPTVSPYNTPTTNVYYPNQQQLSWNFGAQTLAVGSSMTITFAAVAGSAMTVGSYYNQALVSYLPSLSTAATTTATASASNILNGGASLSVTKSNSVGTVTSGTTTSYTVTVANAGPSDAGGAKLKDVPVSGLNCTQITCSQVQGSAVCPTGTTLGVATSTTSLLNGTGITLNSFPASSTISFVVSCGVN